MRILGPTLWVFAVSGTIFLGCAASEVYQDVQQLRRPVGTVTYDSIEVARKLRGLRESATISQFSLLDVFTTPWTRLNSAEQMLVTTGGLNLATFGLQRLHLEIFGLFLHFPLDTRNFTLFSSMFAHSSLLHLGVNTFGLFAVGPSVAAQPTFESSGAHLAAFYLSGGLFASLAQHVASSISKYRFTPSLGASGALYAILGAWALSDPQQEFGFFLTPIKLSAHQFLCAIVAFETWGTLIGWGLPLGHAAHLGGVLVGVGYVYLDGKKKVWQPTRRFAFNQMRRLNMV